VLMTTDGLSHAIQESTKAGARRLEGLYLPDGHRVEPSRAIDDGPDGGTAEAQAQRALARIAKAHNRQEHHRSRRAERERKTVEELEDEESAKKALAILDASSEHEKIMYRDLFNFFDVDKDRTWGSIEFAQRMTDIGYDTSVENASNLLYFAGVRDVDRITFNDFVQLMPKLKAFRMVIERDAMRAFQAKDFHRRGWITRRALAELLTAMSGPDGFDEEYISRIVRTADRERTGMITFDFFIRALFGSPPILAYELPSMSDAWRRRFCFCGGKGLPDESDSDGGEDVRA